MTATEKLRALLDERGVEYSILDESCYRFTAWKSGGLSCQFDENNGEFDYDDTELRVFNLTPEQAITATLGSGECEWELEHSGTLYDKWRCYECKFLFVEPRCDQGYMDLVPNYCPNCGRRVKGGAE